MKNYFPIVMLAMLVGCGHSDRPSQGPPSKSSTPQASVSASPTLVGSTRGVATTGGNNGSGGGHSSPTSSGESSTHTTQGRPSNKAKESAESPSEWRKKHFKPRPFKDFEHLNGYQEVRRLSPQPPNATTRKSGEELYKQACVFCHGLDGKPLRTDPSLTRYHMADLSRPYLYKYGSTPRALYRSIAFGVPAPPMGHFKEVYTKQQIWDLVNYIQSIQRR